MSKSRYKNLEFLFQPRSLALVGITTADPRHWTRVFLEALLEIGFEHPIYLVNPKGGEIQGIKVYRSLKDIPYNVDYVISTVPARTAPALIEECAGKGVKAIHFCTAGFKETGEEEGIRLEAELVRLARREGIAIIGPNCMGIYCPKARLSFNGNFPKESGSVGVISQSGGNAINLVSETAWRGVRFSKVISYGNACDLNESDFLEYLAADPDTKIIALYIEGVKEGKRFRQALERAAKEKPVLLLKGGITQGGARAADSHTGSLAGNEAIWDAMCRQTGVIRVRSLEELADTVVTLVFMTIPEGRNVASVGLGGGDSVLLTDQLEGSGLRVPPLPLEIQNQIREFTPIAGNILKNPIDYSQNMLEIDKLSETISIISRWEGIDFLILFFKPLMLSPATKRIHRVVDAMLKAREASAKPLAVVLVPSVVPKVSREIPPIVQRFISARLPVYYSYASAANALNLVLSHNETRARVN